MGTSTNERALALLGQGLGPEMVASALGVTVSAISQLLSDENFSKQVTEKRYDALSKFVERDSKANELEDILLEKIKGAIPMIFEPMKIAAMYKIVNSAIRRSSGAPEALTNSAPVVQINMPTQIINTFTKNIHNQIVRTGEVDLITIQSGNMDSLLAKSKEGNQNVSLTNLLTAPTF